MVVRNIKLLTVIIFMLTLFSAYASEKMVVRFTNLTNEEVKAMNDDGYDIAAYIPGKYLDVVLDNKEYSKLKKRGLDGKITVTEADMKRNLGNVKDIAGYRTYEEMLAELQQIAADNPSICKLYDIGDSWGKIYSANGNSAYDDYQHDIWAMKISDNVETEEDEPAVFYFGEHHAREPLSLEVAMTVLHNLVDNYGSNSQITSDINNKQIWIVPLVNPNGHKRVLDQTDLWWRKNIRDNNANGQIDPGSGSYQASVDGVDPNRNYGFKWGGVGAATEFDSHTYRGPSAFSEPEIQAIKSLVDSHHFVAGITYHTYSELVLYPYGYASGVNAPDVTALLGLATAMAETIPAQNGGHYTPEQSSDLYPCTGVTDDYTYGERGIFTYTIELATEFIPGASVVNTVCQNNIQAAMLLLHRVDASTLTGHITNSADSQPIVGTVSVEGIDNTGEYRAPYKSDANFGRYYRMLPPGNYTVTFSAYGYESKIETVVISSTALTTLDISLNPVASTAVSGVIRSAIGNQPVENAIIKIKDTPIDSVLTNFNGAYNFSSIPEGTYTITISADGYSSIMSDITISSSSNTFDFVLNIADIEDFETGDFSKFDWTFSGNGQWSIISSPASSVYQGVYSSKSPSIGDSQSSSLVFADTVFSGGEISFYRKVSSEATYDFLRFYIDGSLKGEWSGEVDWSKVSFDVEEGYRTFKWEYAKDQGVSSGDDCAWIDYIVFPSFKPVSISPSSLCKDFELLQNYPNPFNPETIISFNLNKGMDVKLSVFNVKGEVVFNSSKAFYTRGKHSLTFNALALNSGTYFYKIETKEGEQIRKMLLLK